MHIRVPALRERPDDILPLGERFLELYAGKYHRGVRSISEDAATLLKAHFWSGNVRELQNAIEKAVILCEGQEISASDLSLDARSSPAVSSGQTLDQTEERTIREAMSRCRGNLSLVAKELGISRPTLYSKLKKYDI